MQRGARRVAVAVAGVGAGAPVGVRGLHHERRPFPAPARVAHPLPDARGDVRAAVERNHAGLVNHLVVEDHESRRLQDPDGRRVDVRERGPQHAAADAAVVGPQVLRAGVGVVGRRPRAPRLRPARAVGRHRRQPAVRGIDDQRGERRRRPPLAEAKRRHQPRPGPGGGGRIARRKLLLRQHRARAQLRRALERHRDQPAAEPHALEIGIAPGRARPAGSLPGARRCRRPARERGAGESRDEHQDRRSRAGERVARPAVARKAWWRSAARRRAQPARLCAGSAAFP